MSAEISRQRIRRLLKEKSITANAASKRIGYSPSALNQFLNGKSDSIRSPAMSALAKLLNSDVAYLMGETEGNSKTSPSQGIQLTDAHEIPVVGIVEAGPYRPIDEFQTETSAPPVIAPRHPKFPNGRHFAFEVRGDSMNQAGIVEGDIVVCVDWADTFFSPMTGMVVVVERRRDGDLRELTVKEIEVQRESIVLHPRSTNPKHKPLVIPTTPEPHDETQITIIGLVFATTRRIGTW